MKILICSQHFWPETFRINELVDSLMAKAQEVSVLTGKPNYPDGIVYDGYRARGCSVDVWKGARIFRVPIVPRGMKNKFTLALNYLTFIMSGSLFGPLLLRGVRIDVVLVYATSPLLQALPAIMLGKLKKAPVILYIQDLWPDSLEATGYVRSRLILRLVRAVVRFIYKKSDLILVSSRPFSEQVETIYPGKKVIYYPNSVERYFTNKVIQPRVKVNSLLEGFPIIFSGNLGSAQSVQTIIDAAERLNGYLDDIRFVMIGSGSEVKWIRSQIRTRNLKNVFLEGRFPISDMPDLLTQGKALLVTLADRKIFNQTVPNKIQAYLAVGVPIIASMNGEGASIVRESRAGLVSKAEDVDGLVHSVLELYRMPEERRLEMGENGRRYYRANFDHEDLVEQLIGHFEDTIARYK